MTPSADDIRRARIPHNLFMLNLALFHLLMTPAAIAMEIGLMGMLFPLLLSLLTIAYTYRHAESIQTTETHFVYSHWQLAVKRYRLLLISYAITAGLLVVGWLIALASPDPNMQDILQTVFIRIAVMPVVIIVMVAFYLESSAYSNAGKGR